MNLNSSSVPVKILIYSTYAVILTIGMREIASILTTIIFSIFAALLLTPPVRWLKRKGIPSVLSVILVNILFLIIVLILGIMVLEAAIQFVNQVPIYQLNLMVSVDNLTRLIPSRYLSSQDEFSLNSILRSTAAFMISLMKSAISGLVSAGTTAGIIVLTTAFMLIDAANAPEKTESKPEYQSELQRRIRNFGKNLTGFIIIRAETNLITAIGITFFFLLGRIDFAILWGVLIFLLSYIPYIGLVIAAIPPTMLAFFKYGPLGALVFLIIIFGFDAIAENIIFPSLAGKGLKLSPAFLFIALIYWNYVLGSAGILLSIPLTIILKTVFESFEETKWIARLMGPPGDLE